ncbi:MAG: hypothetical protein AAB320_04360 [Elusimicrobiota bacterium]
MAGTSRTSAIALPSPETKGAGPSLTTALLLCAGALLLLWGAFYNGFPLVYNDTGTYLSSGLDLALPLDRPIFYGLFLRATQVLGRSLWLPIAAQALIVSWLVLLVIRTVRPAATTLERAAILLLLAFGTALPWFCGQLMADVFAGLLALSAYLLIFQRASLSRRETLLVGALFTLSLLVHSANVPVAAVLLGLLALDRRLRAGLRLPAVLLLTALVAARMVSRALETDEYRPRYTHVWLMARLIDSGLADRLLQERCAEKNYALCPHKGPPMRTGYSAYFWSSDSPLERIGGWEHSGAATWPVLIDAGRYFPIANFTSIAANGVRQFFSYATGDGLWGYEAVSFVSRVIHERYPRGAPAFDASRQQRGALLGEIAPLSKLHALLAGLALALAALSLLPLPFAPPSQVKGLLGYALVFCVVHALVCAGVLVTDRFGARVVWLVVFAAGLAGLELLNPGAREAPPLPAARLLLILAAALPAGVLPAALALRLLSGTFTRTAPSPYFEKPVLAWPRPELFVKKVPLSSFGDARGLALGVQIKTKLASGRELIGTVTAVGKETVTTQASWESVRW